MTKYYVSVWKEEIPFPSYTLQSKINSFEINCDGIMNEENLKSLIEDLEKQKMKLISFSKIEE